MRAGLPGRWIQWEAGVKENLQEMNGLGIGCRQAAHSGRALGGPGRVLDG